MNSIARLTLATRLTGASLLTLPLVASVQAQSPSERPEMYRELLASFDPAGPGGYIGVYRHVSDSLVEVVFGMADVASAVPMTERTPMYVASVAKTFTAWCAVNAMEDGLLDATDSILETVPELGEAYGDVRVQDLVHHRSGVPDIYDIAIACDLPDAVYASNEAAITLLSALPGPMFTPGTRFVYSNSGYLLLAEAIERAAESDLAAYARANLFAPAGMDEASYVDERPAGPPANSYSRSASQWTPRRVRTGLRGPGGLRLSGRDLLRFEQSVARGVIEQPGVALPPGPNNPAIGRYGAGWMHQSLGAHRVLRHYGGAFGFGADLLRFPDEGLSVVVLVNTDAIDVTDLSEAVARLELGAAYRPRVAPSGIELDPDERRAFGRIWRERPSGRLWVLTDRGDHFVVATFGDLKAKMVPTAVDRLVGIDVQVPFAVRTDGRTLTIEHDDGSSTQLDPVPFPPTAPVTAAEIVGRYVNTSLDVEIELEAGPRGTVRIVQDDPLLRLAPFISIGPRTLVCDQGAQFDVQRDAAGSVRGLTLHANRAWDLAFQRVEGGP